MILKPRRQMILNILALIHTFQTYVSNAWQNFKHQVRCWIGPAPKKIYLLPNDAVSFFQETDVAFFCPTTNLITVENQVITGRGLRMPWVHMEYISVDKTVSFSDRITEIRCHTEFPSLLQTFRMIAMAEMSNLPEINARLVVMTRAGDEEIYSFRGQTTLFLQPPEQSHAESEQSYTDSEQHYAK